MRRRLVTDVRPAHVFKLSRPAESKRRAVHGDDIPDQLSQLNEHAPIATSWGVEQCGRHTVLQSEDRSGVVYPIDKHESKHVLAWKVATNHSYEFSENLLK